MGLLEDVTSHGAQVRKRLHDLLARGEYPGDHKSMALAAYVDVALEYHKAIWLLHANKLHGAAFALVRPGVRCHAARFLAKQARNQGTDRASVQRLEVPEHETAARADSASVFQ